MKYFIITIDTEGDNLWKYHGDGCITTENTKFIPRFQQLCDKYGFKPVYLTNYEMICDEQYAQFARKTQDEGRCEIGVHIHAWNNPPLYQLPIDKTGQPYLIEYPEEIIRKKFAITYNLIKEKTGVSPVSHRAGRWAMNEIYFNILSDFGIKVDCSYTPHVDWSLYKGATKGGSDYRKVPTNAHYIENVLEVPMSIIDTGEKAKVSMRQVVKHLLKLKMLPNKLLWLRPSVTNINGMKSVIDYYSQISNCDYVEFMIHSSEFMPGGSPYYKTKESIEELFKNIEQIFEYAKSKNYIGCTLREYYNASVKRNL